MKLTLSLLMALAFALKSEARPKELSVPPGEILAAARELKPQKGRSYKAEGTLHCSQINREFPPYDAWMDCQIVVGRRTGAVKNPEVLLQAMVRAKPMVGPVYAASARFEARSITREQPKFHIIEKATLFDVQ